MDPEIIPIPLKVPCYLVKTGSGTILIDTGDASDCAALEKALDHVENLKLVILTHGDFDHAGNAAFLQQRCGARIAMHAEDAGMVERGDPGWKRKIKPDRITMYGRLIVIVASFFARSVQFKTFKPDILVEDGQDLSPYGFGANVLHLPGHSKGSIGILTAGGDLFCGDLLMNMLKPDLHFLIDDLPDCTASIQKLKTFAIETVYPGHGKPFPMDRFMKSYLRSVGR